MKPELRKRFKRERDIGGTENEFTHKLPDNMDLWNMYFETFYDQGYSIREADELALAALRVIGE